MGTIFNPAQFSSLVATQWLFIIWITVVRLCLNSVIGFVHFWPFFPSSSSSFLFSIHFLFAFFLLLVPFCVCVFFGFNFFFTTTNMLKSGSPPLIAVTFSDGGSATKPRQSVLG